MRSETSKVAAAKKIRNSSPVATDSTNVSRQVLAALRRLQRGEFDVRMPSDLMGLKGQVAEAFNDVASTLATHATEARALRIEVAQEGRTHKRLLRAGTRGGWQHLVNDTNALLDALTAHTADVMCVMGAIGKGDFSQQIDLEGREGPLKGDFLRHGRLLNGLSGQLVNLTEEITKAADAIAVEGKLGTRVHARGVAGAWKELTNGFNRVASNLSEQVREIAEVTTLVAQGDLSKTVSVEAKGEMLALKKTINTMVAQLEAFASEVSRVAREVGTEGILGGQARVRGVSGIWQELTENVNSMAHNLTSQVRNISEVSSAIARGDLSRKISVEVKGELLDLKNTINTTVDRLGAFAAEVTRVAREVGTEGVLGGQATVNGVSGVWRELTESVNGMANNLTLQVRNIAEVVTAIAEGDLRHKITVEARGEIQTLKATINTTVDKLNRFAAQVSRVARLVGTEGTLGVQAEVSEVSGVWRELTDNVNQMGRNLTNQVRDIATVTTAVANGDLSKKITVEVRGELLQLKNTINTMVDQLSTFADQVTRLATEVGTEGKLGGQADVRGAAGTWRHLTDAVNSMANNLTQQVRNISQAATAIAAGDLTRKIEVEARGEVLEVKNTFNSMIDQLGAFAAEVSRVAREVGMDGRLGGQASVSGVRGIWKELTDNVNLLASNLTNQVRDIAQVASAIAQGDLSRKVTVEVRGEILELKSTINTMVDQLGSFAAEVTRVSRDVGVEGVLGGQAAVRGVSGVWRELTDNVNLMASNLTNQVRDIAEVTTAVANGDLTRKITVEVRGELAELKKTINTMVDQLNAFGAEVSRVAREVGTEGVLGGQANVPGISGVWKELTDNVNLMARNLTAQVGGIARVVTAVARGDLTQSLVLDARGEIASLVETINGMIGTLSVFAQQVTGVARDVGVEGRLGGQADVPGAAGLWRDLTNNVNELAGNLTRQVRAIGDVATAVTKGDLTQSITVDARGEVAQLKDNINQMIRTLATTTTTNQQQDWLKSNLARFTRMLQGQRDLVALANQVLTELAPVVGAQHGTFFLAETVDGKTQLKLFASYAYKERKNVGNIFGLGEGLVGQAARELRRITVTDVPETYVKISSSLGESTPRCVVVVPIVFEGLIKGALEFASFTNFTPTELAFLDQLVESLGIVVAAVEATMRTDDLLRKSQGMAEELQTQQEELQQTNEELEEKASQLTEQKSEVERKNREVELARQELEEKAEQLSLTSRYKSEFLANMSHELRTPLNSLLILSRQLTENRAGNLSEKQVEFARTINQAGADLLSLINEILHLAKVESGTLELDFALVTIADLKDYVVRTFEPMATEKHLTFHVDVSDSVPAQLNTDDMRLKQILRNLLSNALKFTEKGSVSLTIDSPAKPAGLIAFKVKDTGIGIPRDKQRIVFEAFQQADGSTSRKFGGTGLGLAISREIAGLLGGEIRLSSEAGVGSTFSLTIPIDFSRVVKRNLPAAGRSGDMPPAAAPAPTQHPKPSPKSAFLIATAPDDRGSLSPGERSVLIVEDDENFAGHLMDLARERGFKAILANNGVDAFELAKNMQPHAVTLDLGLPDMDGWVLLDQLKHHPQTRHIPVHLISGAEEANRRGLEQGALAVLKKPVSSEDLNGLFSGLHSFLEKRVKNLLVVEDDLQQRNSIVELIGDGDVKTTAVASGQQALNELETSPYDCIVTDLKLPDMTGFELIRQLKERPSLQRIPIVVYTGKELSRAEELELRRLAESITVKGARSPDRLLDETTLFLHRVESKLPAPKRAILRRLAETDPSLADKHVLVVDDDARNLFAITTLLEQHSMCVSFAENGREALAKLEALPDINVVLMDIMMPEMNGYEATQAIRKMPQYANIPVIALTAKAMKGDREKCLEAGASDYITKPVDPNQLVSLLRVWLYR